MDYHSNNQTAAVRPACEKDIDEVMEVDRLSFSNPWIYNYFKLSLTDMFLVFEQKQILGYLIGCLCDTANKAVILRIAVHPDHRRKGVAKALLEKCIQMAAKAGVREVELDVEIYQQGAVKLYEGLGFKTKKISYFMDAIAEDSETFYIMTLTLSEPGEAA